MALVVEDGTGLASADALISLVRANQIHTDHNNTDWASASDAEKEGGIRDASLFMTYSLRWQGWPTGGRLQALGFPRVGLVDRNGYDVASNAVPVEAELAVAFLALFIVQDGSAPLTTTTATADKHLIRKKVGPLEKQWQIARQDPQAARPTVLFALETISAFIRTDGAGSMLAGTRGRA